MMAADVIPLRARDFVLVPGPLGRRIACDTCKGRGWRLAKIPNAWPLLCGVCSGRGSFSLYRIAKVIGEDPSNLYRLVKGELGPRVALRLLEKLVRLSS